MPLFAIPFPAIDPVAVAVGPVCRPLVRLRLIAGLLIGWRYCLILADRPPRLVERRDIDDFPSLGDTRHRTRRADRLCAVLPCTGLLSAAPARSACICGMAGCRFIGGALGVTIAIILFTRARRRPIFAFSDIIAEAIPIGLFFGRIANFINGELFGRETDVSWGVVFRMGGPVARHPSQLYEAVCEWLLLFLLLLFAEHRGARQRPGIITGLFLIGYAVARMSGRAVSPARRTAGFPGVRHDDGAAAVNPGADRRHRIDPVGISEAGATRRGAWSCRRPVSPALSG